MGICRARAGSCGKALGEEVSLGASTGKNTSKHLVGEGGGNGIEKIGRNTICICIYFPANRCSEVTTSAPDPPHRPGTPNRIRNPRA